jgi:hypothetical protein
MLFTVMSFRQIRITELSIENSFESLSRSSRSFVSPLSRSLVEPFLYVPTFQSLIYDPGLFKLMTLTYGPWAF